MYASSLYDTVFTLHSSLNFVRQLLNSTLFSAPPFQYTGKSGRALCTEYRAGLAKLLPSHPMEGGKKCCRRVSVCIYTYVREKFSVLRVGVWGEGWTHAPVYHRIADVTVLHRTLLWTRACTTFLSWYYAFHVTIVTDIWHETSNTIIST